MNERWGIVVTLVAVRLSKIQFSVLAENSGVRFLVTGCNGRPNAAPMKKKYKVSGDQEATATRPLLVSIAERKVTARLPDSPVL